MAKLNKKSLPRQIADDIELNIKKGVYNIGDKLPTEPELVAHYGVSRNTLREAIQSLTNSGILETRQGDGTYVVARERLQVDFFHAMGSTNSENVLEVRNMLENSIVELAIVNATCKDIEDIEHYLALRKAVCESARENTKADLDFHTAIARATHNELIVAIYKYVSAYFNEYIYDKIYRKSQDEQYIDEIPDLLFSAIRDKNVGLAKDCVRKIIEI